MFKNLFTPHGRVSRRYFWSVGTISFVGALASFSLVQTAAPTSVSISILSFIFSAIFLWINLVTQIKRWHDIDRSGWAILWNILPGGTIVILCVCGFYPGTSGPNRFGDRQMVMPPPLPPVFEDREAQTTTATRPTSSGRRNTVIAFSVLLVALLCVFTFFSLRETFFLNRSIPSASKMVFDKVKTRIVMIAAFDAFGHEIMQGSGVILGESPSNDRKGPSRLVKGTDIVTNYHIIRYADYVVVSTESGTLHLGAVIHFNEDYDLALLRIPLEMGFDNTPIKSPGSVGDPVYTISNPQGLGWTLSEGIISRMPAILDDRLQFTAPISAGSSGGGLFDSQGNLIGIITSSLKESQNINFAIVLSYWIYGINDLRQRHALPFSSIDLGDWQAGDFKVDNEDRQNQGQYNRRSNLKNAYTSKKQAMLDQAGQKFNSLSFSERTEDTLRAVFSAYNTAFYTEAQESISYWREEHPNDSDAILAYIRMLISTGRDIEASDELAAALDQFPFNIDVIREAASVLFDNGRNDSVVGLLTEVSKQAQAPLNYPQHFSDEWSTQQYNAGEVERTFKRRAFIENFNHLVEVYQKAGLPLNNAKIK